MLPVAKTMRKIIQYRAQPSKPGLDWYVNESIRRNQRDRNVRKTLAKVRTFSIPFNMQIFIIISRKSCNEVEFTTLFRSLSKCVYICMYL